MKYLWLNVAEMHDIDYRDDGTLAVFTFTC